MSIRQILISTLAVLMVVTLISCQQDQPQVVAPENSFDQSKIWTDEEIAHFYENDFVRPETPMEYEIQFLGRKHRSQLSPDELQILLDKEEKIRNKYRNRTIEEVQAITRAQLENQPFTGSKSENPDMIQSVSSYFFYVEDYDSRDWEWFDTANMSYGNMVYPYSTSPWVWDTNTDYMTSTSTVTTCRNFLSAMCENSDIGPLVSSSTGYSNCSNSYPEEPIVIYGGMMKLISGKSGGSDDPVIASVPTSYVETNLNPGFESWSGGYPEAWNISISSPYNIPSGWNSYYSTASVTQSTDEYQGTYAAQLALNRNIGRSLASAYYVLPGNSEEGEYTASIYYGGTPQTVQLVLEIALYDNTDALIGTATGNMSVGTGGAYKLNSITLDTGTDVPKYVRFNVRQAVGQNTNSVRVDNLSLRGPLGDISLPVSWHEISDYEYEYYRKAHLEWDTWSELGTIKWALFARIGGTQYQISNDYETAAGNTSEQTFYDKSFYIHHSLAWLNVYYYGLDVYLGVQDSEGWEYFEDDAVTIGPVF